MMCARSLALAAITVVGIAACAGDDDRAATRSSEVIIPGPTGTYESPVWPTPVPNEGVNVPRLTPDDVATARSIIEGDPLMQALLRHTSHEVESIGPWLEDDALAGVSVTIALDDPLTIEADWPRVVRSDSGGWRSAVSHYTVHDLEKMGWLVNLDARTVDAIDVFSYSYVDPN